MPLRYGYGLGGHNVITSIALYMQQKRVHFLPLRTVLFFYFMLIVFGFVTWRSIS